MTWAFLFLNTVLLLAALAGDLARRLRVVRPPAPALGIALAVTRCIGYVLEILGTLWPDAEFLQPYSPFHYLHPFEILGGGAPRDLLVLLGVFAIAAGYGLWHFPRRDLAAPSSPLARAGPSGSPRSNSS